MNVILFFIFEIGATDGGSRPNNGEIIDKGPDLDYNDTDFDYLALDIFDLLQNIILRDQVKVNVYNTTNTAQNCTPSNVLHHSEQIDVNIFNTTHNWTNKSLQITVTTLTILCVLLNIYTIYAIASIQQPIMPLQKTYYAASTIDE